MAERLMTLPQDIKSSTYPEGLEIPSLLTFPLILTFMIVIGNSCIVNNSDAASFT